MGSDVDLTAFTIVLGELVGGVRVGYFRPALLADNFPVILTAFEGDEPIVSCWKNESVRY